jgi:Protein of unknown function (DUF3105)
LTLAGCGGSDSGGDNAHINLESGSTNGAAPDERVGKRPPPIREMGLKKAAEAADCYLRQGVSPENDEVASGAGATAEQQADGAYLVQPKESATVAALNHGRMVIEYAPDLPERIQLELKGLYDSMYGGTLFFPNETLEWAVTATTWGNALECTGYEGAVTMNAIRAFGRQTWGKYGNVPLDKFPVSGPTPADPEEPSAGAVD